MKVPVERTGHEERFSGSRLSHAHHGSWVGRVNLSAMAFSLLCRASTLILKHIWKYKACKAMKGHHKNLDSCRSMPSTVKGSLVVL